MRPRLRSLLLLPVLAATAEVALTWLAPVAIPSVATRCDAATWTHHVALVVEHQDGASIRLCIGFDAPAISGSDILAASGIEYATAGYGSLGHAVCQLDHEPASYPPSCWTTTSPYWAMFVSRAGGGWQVASHGIDAEQFADGDAEGFRYDSQDGAALPPVSPTGTCTAVAPARTGSPSAPPGATPHLRTAAPSATSHAGAPSAPTATGRPRASTAPTASSTPGVAAVATGSGTTAGGTGGGISLGVLAAVVVAGALAGVLAVQLLVRRRTP